MSSVLRLRVSSPGPPCISLTPPERRRVAKGIIRFVVRVGGELHEAGGLDSRGCGPGHERGGACRGAEGLLAGMGGRRGGGWLRWDPGGTFQPHRQKPAGWAHAPGRDLPRERTLQGGERERGPGAGGTAV